MFFFLFGLSTLAFTSYSFCHTPFLTSLPSPVLLNAFYSLQGFSPSQIYSLLFLFQPWSFNSYLIFTIVSVTDLARSQLHPFPPSSSQQPSLLLWSEGFENKHCILIKSEMLLPSYFLSKQVNRKDTRRGFFFPPTIHQNIGSTN